eukprot:5966470-Pleurochrysis_carterae.AAC.1
MPTRKLIITWAERSRDDYGSIEGTLDQRAVSTESDVCSPHALQHPQPDQQIHFEHTATASVSQL